MGEAMLQIDVTLADRDASERACAEAWDAGAVGIEEQTSDGGQLRLRVYAPSSRVPQVLGSLDRLGSAARVGEPMAVPEQDWSQAWRQGLQVIEISPRLAVRPSFLEHTASGSQRVLVLDPGQAFGTGHHASTRLALRLLDDAIADLGPGALEARVLDVGTGAGVLALAAVALGAKQAVAFDVDPLAAPEARANADRNGLGARVAFFTGPVAAVEGPAFELIVANMLRTEVEPLLEDLVARLAPSGRLLLSGLLDRDRALSAEALRGLGLRVVSELTQVEDADHWIALDARRGGVT